MKKLGIIGWPLGHSISPAFQQAALDHCGIKARYHAYEVRPAELPAFMARVRSEGWLGLNVTVPHKEAVASLVDELSPEARAIGAVNTVVNQGSRLIGHNTDASGFRESLLAEAGFDPAGRHAVLLGAGGAGRAVAFTLLSMGVGAITICNRHQERAEALADHLRRHSHSAAMETVPWGSGELEAKLEGCDLLVNATSVGLHPGETPLPGHLLPPQALVYDLIYSPPVTRFLAEAQQRGARTLNGLAMLIYQGAAAFELWAGQLAPLGVMRAAAEAALRSKT